MNSRNNCPIHIATPLLRYVLPPRGQISFWRLTAITNILSAIPHLRRILFQLLRGGFAIDNKTGTRFFIETALKQPQCDVCFRYKPSNSCILNFNDVPKLIFNLRYTD